MAHVSHATLAVGLPHLRLIAGNRAAGVPSAIVMHARLAGVAGLVGLMPHNSFSLSAWAVKDGELAMASSLRYDASSSA